MSKKMTPCEKLGYKVGDKFEVIRHHAFKNGQVVTLHEDDGTECPLFAGDGGGAGVFDGVECSLATLNKQVRKIANKLKPAKQALADAIHQNGGWRSGANLACQHGLNRMVVFSASGLAPTRNAARGMACWNSGAIFFGGFQFDRKLPNWHQCILSRDEYFTAYPEQVKVEICNETKHKVEVEMKSESDETINASDWHKNGELPPAGTWCTLHAKENNGEEVMFIGVTSCNSPVFETVQNMIFVERGEFRFSPLRTERDKAIDEMVCEFIDHYGDPKGGEHYIRIATKLYDAGYRKEVK